MLQNHKRYVELIHRPVVSVACSDVASVHWPSHSRITAY